MRHLVKGPKPREAVDAMTAGSPLAAGSRLFPTKTLHLSPFSLGYDRTGVRDPSAVSVGRTWHWGRFPSLRGVCQRGHGAAAGLQSPARGGRRHHAGKWAWKAPGHHGGASTAANPFRKPNPTHRQHKVENLCKGNAFLMQPALQLSPALGLQEPRDFPDQSPRFGFYHKSVKSLFEAMQLFGTHDILQQAGLLFNGTVSVTKERESPFPHVKWYSAARSGGRLLWQVSDPGQQALLPLSANKIEEVEQHCVQLQPRAP